VLKLEMTANNVVVEMCEPSRYIVEVELEQESALAATWGLRNVIIKKCAKTDIE
jgi:hypothetical protein